MNVRFKWGMSGQGEGRVGLSRDAEMSVAPRVGDLVVTMTGYDGGVVDLLILPWDEEFGAYVTLQDWNRATVADIEEAHRVGWTEDSSTGACGHVRAG